MTVLAESACIHPPSCLLLYVQVLPPLSPVAAAAAVQAPDACGNDEQTPDAGHAEQQAECSSADEHAARWWECIADWW